MKTTYWKYILIVIGIGLGLFGGAYFLTPRLDLNKDTSIYLVDRYGRAISHQIRDDRRSLIYHHLKQIPDFFIQLALYREDRRFYDHYGIDFRAWLRVALSRYQDGTLHQGGSTIDQQVAKLLLGHHDRTLGNKLKERWYARCLNIWYSKDQILLAYFNHIYFGSTIRGLALACDQWYHTPCVNLSQEQMILLWSRSKFPGRKDVTHYTSGFATRLKHDLPHLILTDLTDIDRSKFLGQTPFFSDSYPHISQYISEHIDVGLTTGLILTQNGSIWQTSIDLDLVDHIQSILIQYKPYLASQSSTDACVVVIDNGSLLSMNVARSWYDPDGGMINPCTRPRQVGSAIKPFVYTLAMYYLGLQSGSQIVDKPVSFFVDNGGIYAPKNFDLTYHGTVTIGQALGNSLNTPAITLLNQIGIDTMRSRLRDIAHIVGTTQQFIGNPYHYGLSLALGSIELSPIDFTKMYQIFHHFYPSLSLYQKNLSEVQQILGDNTTRLISFPLENRFDIPSTWVKSGTSRHFVDGRACGGVKRFTVCIRVGNYNAKPTKDSGYNTAGVLRYQIAHLLLNR